jgi:hypothetical protein
VCVCGEGVIWKSTTKQEERSITAHSAAQQPLRNRGKLKLP